MNYTLEQKKKKKRRNDFTFVHKLRGELHWSATMVSYVMTHSHLYQSRDFELVENRPAKSVSLTLMLGGHENSLYAASC
jgi:hypothetical protein